VELAKAVIIDPEFKCLDVTKITYQGSAIEHPFVQTGPKRGAADKPAASYTRRNSSTSYHGKVSIRISDESVRIIDWINHAKNAIFSAS
jgi:hypothetical protein